MWLLDNKIEIVRMLETECRNGGEALQICYCIRRMPYGKLLVATTKKGICWLSFATEDAWESLRRLFPNATYKEVEKCAGKNLEAERCTGECSEPERQCKVTLHLKGTDFQLMVWETLLKVPFGTTISYGQLARMAGVSKACRAVGTAVGGNPVSILIPCHRVIRADGTLGNYRWGAWNKAALLKYEGLSL